MIVRPGITVWLGERKGRLVLFIDDIRKPTHARNPQKVTVPAVRATYPGLIEEAVRDRLISPEWALRYY
jgi:hypothetical protein